MIIATVRIHFRKMPPEGFYQQRRQSMKKIIDAIEYGQHG